MNAIRKWFLLLLLVTLSACVPVAAARTPDLYATANAAQRDAQLYGQFLTGTADAPIIHITETAAALVIQQQYFTTTAQWEGTQTAIPMTQTEMARPTATATITATPTVDATGTLMVSLLIAQQKEIELETERKQNSNTFNTILAPMVFLIIVLAIAFLGITISRMLRMKVIPRDARGDAPLLQDIVSGEIIDPDPNPNYSTGKRNKSSFEIWLEEQLHIKPQLPAVTAERQDQAKHNDQMIDLVTRGLPAPMVRNGDAQQKRLAVQTMANQITANGLQNRFEILGDGEQPPAEFIDGEVVKVLEKDWKEGKK